MTAIIGLKEKGQVLLGSDGFSNMGIRKMPSNHSKIFAAEGSPHILLAVAGNVIANHALRNQPNLFEGKKDVSYHYLVSKFIPWLWAFAQANNAFDQSTNSLLFEIIIATRSQLFNITAQGVVAVCRDFVALGSGQSVAYFHYKAHQKESMAPAQRVRGALEATIRYSAGLGYPIVLASPDTDKALVLNEDGASCVEELIAQ
jgi:ATP-dependent protease HslVU (ClpYQ) peptidase subunit